MMRLSSSRSGIRLEASEEEFIGNEWRKKRVLEDAFDKYEVFVLLREVVSSVPSQVEVVGEAFHDCRQFFIPLVEIKDEALNLARCRCLHNRGFLQASPEFEIVECEVGGKVKAGFKHDGKLFG